MPFLVRWPAAIKAGIAQRRDGAEHRLRADVPRRGRRCTVPADMQGRSLLPLLAGKTPRTGATSMYYRYYHDPGDHNTRAHYGVRTATHKLIHFWKKDQWELFDLVRDPTSSTTCTASRARRSDPDDEGGAPAAEEAAQDEDQFANEQLPNGVDGPPAKLRGK